MATPPTFTTGSVLTAAQMNQVGLWRVGGGSFVGASSFDVIGFSSDYKFYRLEYSAQRVDTTGNTTLVAQLYSGATARTTTYYGSGFYTSYLGTSGVGFATNNGASFTISFADSGGKNIASYDIAGMTSQTFSCTGNFWDAGNARQYMNGASHFVTETNDKIRISTTGGTITGEWRLYGYREP